MPITDTCNTSVGKDIEFLPEPNRNKSKLIMNLPRGQMRRLIELITGQNNLNHVQSKIDPIEISPYCRFCGEEDETPEHLLNECPCFLSYKQNILQNKPIINTLDWKLQKLLELSYIPEMDQALAHE